MVQPAFFDGHVDVGEDAEIVGLNQRKPPPAAAALHDFDFGVEHLDLVVALVLVRLAQFLDIVFQLVGIESLGEYVL